MLNTGTVWGLASKIMFYKRVMDMFHDQFMEHKLPNSLEICQNDP